MVYGTGGRRIKERDGMVRVRREPRLRTVLISVLSWAVLGLLGECAGRLTSSMVPLRVAGTLKKQDIVGGIES